MPPTRWAVTGATGLLGNNLVRTLVARGCDVSVLARGAGRKELAGLPLRVVPGDLGDPRALAACFEGAEVVVHAAASVWIGETGREEAQRVNVDGTRAVCDALPDRAWLLHVSSVDALGIGSREHPATEATAPRPEEGGVAYVDTKREADRVVRASGKPHLIVHPCFMIGAWDWRPSSSQMVLEVARGRARLAPSGGNNFVDVDDVVAGMLAAAGRAPDGSAWILGNENLSYFEAWSRIAKEIGAPAPLAEVPRWAGRIAEAALRLPVTLGAKEGVVNAAITRMSFLPHYFDSTKARQELGLPATPLEVSARKALTWFEEHGYR